MLLSMIFPTFIAAIFDEVAAITFLQFDVINFCDAAVSTTYVCFCQLCRYPFFCCATHRGYLLNTSTTLLIPDINLIRRKMVDWLLVGMENGGGSVQTGSFLEGKNANVSKASILHLFAPCLRTKGVFPENGVFPTAGDL